MKFRSSRSNLIDTITTKTGDILHLSECKENDVTYGLISFKLKESYESISDAKNVLLKFMHNLQPLFAIQHTAGPDFETVSVTHKLAVTDYWQDVENRDWKVKGWTDGNTIAVLYIKNINNIPISVEDYFLNGQRFTTA